VTAEVRPDNHTQTFPRSSAQWLRAAPKETTAMMVESMVDLENIKKLNVWEYPVDRKVRWACLGVGGLDEHA